VDYENFEIRLGGRSPRLWTKTECQNAELPLRGDELGVPGKTYLKKIYRVQGRIWVSRK
jgi:hypothetical protein